MEEEELRWFVVGLLVEETVCCFWEKKKSSRLMGIDPAANSLLARGMPRNVSGRRVAERM
jgi:hypothetical protein